YGKSKKLKPAMALTQAIIRLRQISKKEVRTFIENLRLEVSLTKDEGSRLDRIVSELFKSHQREEIFDSTEFWAGFTCTGLSEI
ncbi:hypothetical protein MJD09_00265, partial [bacterium]|nr:hypothetical protein [bacterium]